MNPNLDNEYKYCGLYANLSTPSNTE